MSPLSIGISAEITPGGVALSAQGETFARVAWIIPAYEVLLIAAVWYAWQYRA